MTSLMNRLSAIFMSQWGGFTASLLLDEVEHKDLITSALFSLDFDFRGWILFHISP